MGRQAEEATDADVARLDTLVDEMRHAHAENDIALLAEIDLRFHGLLVELSGFSLLRHIWGSLDGLVRVRSYQALYRPGRASRYFLSGSIQSHTQLLDALRTRDPDTAARAVRAHILDVVDQLHQAGA